MTDELYDRDVLRLAADADGTGALAAPKASATIENARCGDRATVDVRLEDGRIVALAHDIRACLLAQASATVMARAAKGMDAAAVSALRGAVAAMLAEGRAAIAPAGYDALLPVHAHPMRHACVLLPLDALADAVSVAQRTADASP